MILMYNMLELIAPFICTFIVMFIIIFCDAYQNYKFKQRDKERRKLW